MNHPIAVPAPGKGKTDGQQLRSRPGRRLRRAALALLLVFMAAGVGAKLYLDRVEGRAQRLASTGTSLNTFFKDYVDGLKSRDVGTVVKLHDARYVDERDGSWDETFVSSRDGVDVYAWTSSSAAPMTPVGLRAQTESQMSRFATIESGKIRIASIESLNADGSAVIRAVLWLRGSTPERRTRESWTTLRFRLRPLGSSWTIMGKELISGQTVIGAGEGFVDVTKQAGIDFEAGHNPMLLEPEWFPKKFGIMKYATAGVAAADYDNDGLCDIFFADGAHPCLYRNKGDGTFEDVTTMVGLPADLKAVHVALLVDLDNDGNRELFLGRSTGPNYLFRNEGRDSQGRHRGFTDVSATANIGGVWVATAAAADYDNDGKVDLYLGRYLDPRKNLPTTNFYTRNGEGNSLLHNEGQLQFRDVTESAGVREGGLTLGISFADYDRDGDQDIYVANDFGRNALFRNNGNGTFTDVSRQAGTTNLGYGMSASFADIDNDGDLDVYVASVHSGQRWFGNGVTLQRYFVTSLQEGTIVDDYPLYRELLGLTGWDWQTLGERVIRGNSLFLNNGDGTFTDVTEKCKANPHGWYWSSQIADLDNDGLQDIYAVNGWITGKTEDDL